MLKKLVSITLVICMMLSLLVGCVNNGGNTGAKVERVSFNQEKMTLKVGEVGYIHATVMPSELEDAKLVWKSSDESVATVSRGQITAVSKGETIITATSENGKYAMCIVSVVADKESGGDKEPDDDKDVTTTMGTGACEYLETRDISGRDIKYVEMCVEGYGRLVILLDATTAPITVANFISLVEDGFYDGLTFHRIIKDFMIQGGDPKGDGTGGSENKIEGEFSSNGHDNDISHLKGVISMARASDPNSASSQFFICNADASASLDGNYAAFGYVVEGMSVIDAITNEVFPKTLYADYYGSYEIDPYYQTYKHVVWQYFGNGMFDNKADQPVIKYIKVLDSWDGAPEEDDTDVSKDPGMYDGSEVTITFYHTMGYALRAVLDDAITRFQETYPNIKIVHQSLGDYDEIFSQIKTKIVAGKQPNIAFCYPDHIATYNTVDAVLTLDDLIANNNVVASSGEMMGFTQAQIDDFVDAFYDEGREFGDGKMYSLPFQKSTELLYYDKTAFEQLGLEAPKTWDDVENAIKVLKEIYPNSTPIGYDSESNLFITLAEQYGNHYTSSTGEHYLFNNEGNKAFVAKFAEWYQKGWITTQNLYGGYTSDLFIKENNEVGKVFMCVASSAGARYQRPNKINDEYPFEVGIVPVPQVDLYNPKVISRGPSLCIFKDDNIQEVYASWLFLKFLTTDVQFQAQYSMQSGYIPAIQSVTETPVYNSFLEKADGGDFITSLAIKVAIEQKDYYFSTPAFVGSAVARENVGLLLQSVFARWVLGADNSAMIDEQFLKYYNYCKENN